MRSALLVARKHGSKKLATIAGPSTNGPELVRILSDFKKLGASHTNEDYEQVELWTSDAGRSKIRRFVTKAADKRRAEAEAKLNKPQETAAVKPEVATENPTEVKTNEQELFQ